MNGEIHALSGAYAIDALDETEREAFEHHLVSCSACQIEVNSLQEAAATLAETVALAPPAHLRDAVLRSARTIRPLPPVVPVVPVVPVALDAKRRSSRRGWLSGSLIAAAAVALFVVWIQPRASTPAPNISAASQIVNAQDAVKVRQQLPSGATVAWYRSARLNAAAISITDLPGLGVGKTYELWLESRDGVMHPAGLLKGGTQLVALTGPAAAAIGAGLTEEPTGGSMTPTLPAVTLASFPTA